MKLIHNILLTVILFTVVNPNAVKAQAIKESSIKKFESIIQLIEAKEFGLVTEQVEELLNSPSLNNTELAFLYNFQLNVALQQERDHLALELSEKILALDHVPKKIKAEVESTRLRIKKKIEETLPDYRQNQHILKNLDEPVDNLEKMYLFTKAAMNLSKNSEADKVISVVSKHFKNNDLILPAKWAALKLQRDCKTNEDDLCLNLSFAAFEEYQMEQFIDLESTILELAALYVCKKGSYNECVKVRSDLVKLMPSHTNKIALISKYYRSESQAEFVKANAMITEMYDAGELTNLKDLKILMGVMNKLGNDNYEYAVIVSKAKHDGIISLESLNDNYFKSILRLAEANAKKNKKLSGEYWLSIGDKFVQYKDYGNAKFAYAKAKKKKSTKKTALQKLKELKSLDN